MDAYRTPFGLWAIGYRISVMEASLQIVPCAANGFALEIPISRFPPTPFSIVYSLPFSATLAQPLRKGYGVPEMLVAFRGERRH